MHILNLNKGDAVKFRSSKHGVIHYGSFVTWIFDGQEIEYHVKPSSTRNCTPDSIWKIKPKKGHEIWKHID